ncbi:hypothetical protein TL16_g00950 [Triparma laevis f. inornata]|uniref:Uncharacterized protein n=2 Tax=Triparma laevis TaxID=1534972 RepID=A0A9W7FA44_9STRA|nr:hypothetical protein TL16_g00950 [Triparma laevis f. inornata]GMI08426.1 hypothetical protein TrLO_g4647 [Triparma laevis f. longispina]
MFWYLNIATNNLSGEVPSLSSIPSLSDLEINDNDFSGPFLSLSTNPLLQFFLINNNRFSGQIPDFSATPLLQNLLAHNNDFSSTVFPALFDLNNITNIMLSGNVNLKGTLPAVFFSPSLLALVIEGCKLTGPLPTNITSPLESFYLAGNFFTSFIPSLPPTIIDVSLAYNQFSGSIPDSFFSNTPNLNSFDVRHNDIGGSIPTSLSYLTNLVDLKLDLNNFSGVISSDISTWPIFAANDTNNTILFGNLWACPLPDIVREHSDEDPGHAYSCAG